MRQIGLALLILGIGLSGCGKQQEKTYTFCGSQVVVSPQGPDPFPAAVVSLPSGAFVKFCQKNDDGSIDPWRGGYRSTSTPSCGFWGSPAISTQELTLIPRNVDCP